MCIFISYLYLYLSYSFEWDHMSMHVCMCIVQVHACPWACKNMHEHICLWIVSVYGYFHALCQRLDVGLWWLQCISNGVMAVLHWALNVCMCIDEYPSIPSDTLTLWFLTAYRPLAESMMTKIQYHTTLLGLKESVWIIVVYSWRAISYSATWVATRASFFS